jgi:hypothetical protein
MGTKPLPTIPAEATRQGYRPDEVQVLFISESPPKDGTFFYRANSELFTFTNEAFAEFYPDCGAGASFLQFFQARGFYVEDLCLGPITHLPHQTRESKRERCVEPLARRIQAANPIVIIGVTTEIKKYIQQAIGLAQLERLRVVYFLPSPAEGYQKRYVDELVAALRHLKQIKILS